MCEELSKTWGNHLGIGSFGSVCLVQISPIKMGWVIAGLAACGQMKIAKWEEGLNRRFHDALHSNNRKGNQLNKILTMISSVSLHSLQRLKPYRWLLIGGFSVINPFTPSLLQVALASGTDQEQIRKEFETLAAEMPYVDMRSVLYYGSNWVALETRHAEESLCQRILNSLRSRPYSKQSLLQLLSHPDADVRTLVAIGLFELEDPTALPALVTLTKDSSRTFDSPGAIRSNGTLGPPEAQTVSGIAKQMLSFWMKWSGFFYGVSHATQPDFNDYWEDRKDRQHCAGWFGVQMFRAGHGDVIGNSEREEKYREIRNRIGSLPGDDQILTLLWLRGEIGVIPLVEESELLALCKKISPEQLLKILRREVISDDPDLQPKHYPNSRYNRITLFILQNTGVLLRAQDLKALEECELQERNYALSEVRYPLVTAWWSIAKASLLPQSQALTELLEAHARFQGEAYDRIQGEINLGERIDLSFAIWKLVGESESEFLINWFYNENLSGSSPSNPNPTDRFISQLLHCDSPSGIKLIKAIVEDHRFKLLEHDVVVGIRSAILGWKQESKPSWEYPIRPREEYRQSVLNLLK